MPILYVIIFIPQKSVKNLFLLVMGCEGKTGGRYEVRGKRYERGYKNTGTRLEVRGKRRMRKVFIKDICNILLHSFVLTKWILLSTSRRLVPLSLQNGKRLASFPSRQHTRLYFPPGRTLWPFADSQAACGIQAIRHENLSGFLQTTDRKPVGFLSD